MILEASIALLVIMGLTWAAAIWATCQEESGEDGYTQSQQPSTGISEKSSKKVA